MMNQNLEHPRATSIIVCDAIYHDNASQKPSLLGVFAQISDRASPMRLDEMAIYVQLTNGHGEMVVTITLKDDVKPHVIARLDVGLNFASPMNVVDCFIELENVVFPDFGRYTVEVSCGGVFVGQTLINAIKIS